MREAWEDIVEILTSGGAFSEQNDMEMCDTLNAAGKRFREFAYAVDHPATSDTPLCTDCRSVLVRVDGQWTCTHVQACDFCGEKSHVLMLPDEKDGPDYVCVPCVKRAMFQSGATLRSRCAELAKAWKENDAVGWLKDHPKKNEAKLVAQTYRNCAAELERALSPKNQSS